MATQNIFQILGSHVWVRVKQLSLRLEITNAPCTIPRAHVAVSENVLGVDILLGKTLQTTVKKCWLKIRVTKTVLRGEAKWDPSSFSAPGPVVHRKPHPQPGGHAEMR